MLQRHVLAALAVGISAGDDDAARKHLRRIDPVLRGGAKRKLERALIDAALATNEPGGGDEESARHIMRVAALSIAKRPINNFDRDAVSEAYRALPVPSASRVPLATILAVLGTAALVAGALLAVALRPGPAKRVYARPLPVPAAGAYKDGGTPLADAAIATVLTEQLPKFIIATDRDRNSYGEDPARAANAKELKASPALTSKGPALAAAWGGMIDHLDRWAVSTSGDLDFERDVRAFRASVRGVSDQFAVLGIGYYLEADVFENGSGAHAVVYAYRVEEVVLLTAQRATGPEKRRVLGLRRLDRLNMSHTLLGMQSLELGDPVLLLDQIDGFVVTDTIPVLEPGAPYPLGDDELRRAPTPEHAKLMATAGEVARTEWLAALGADASRTTEIAKLFAERALILEKWGAVLEGRGWRLDQVESLFVPPTLLDQLEGVVTNSERERVRAMEEKLAELEAPRIASRLLEMVAATVRRHEAQHGMDDDRAAPLKYPAQLAEWIGPELDDEGRPRRSAERARAELAAYVSQIANDPHLPRVSVLNVVRFAYNDFATNTPESYAGILIVEGLARHLGIPSPSPVVHGRRIDRERMTALLTALLAKSGDEIRGAATKLWLELFGEPIVPILDR